MGNYVAIDATLDLHTAKDVTTPGRLDERPLLVFWEMTKACDLACRHCRASAQLEPASDELNLYEGRPLIDELVLVGRSREVR